MHYDKITRLLHWAFALLIPLQLLSEELMKRPKPGRIREEMQIFFFEMHEWVGMLLLVVIVARFAWAFISKEFSLARLYPYFNSQHRAKLWYEITHEVPSWFKGEIHEPSSERFIASSVHGLGLLLVLLMGVSGAIMLYGMEETGQMLGFVHEMKELHEILGEVLWIYLFTHVGMALIHMLVGHKILSRIFKVRG